MTIKYLDNFYVRYKPVRKTWEDVHLNEGIPAIWYCATSCVCVCVCVWERERDFHSVTGHPVWWNDIFYLHCDSESYFLQIWTFCHLCTCQNGKKSPVYFSPILSEMFPSFFHYLVLAGRLDALFFPRIYLLIPGNQAEWGITILPFYFSTIFIHRIPQSCSLRPLFEQRMNVFSHAPKRLYSLTLFFAPSSVFVHFCKSGLMIGHWNKLSCLDSRNVWIKEDNLNEKLQHFTCFVQHNKSPLWFSQQHVEHIKHPPFFCFLPFNPFSHYMMSIVEDMC